ncbi:phage virion morphogenesis protein [Cardiobacterium sp. AH-315-I02]|nr:phage virion morphogenesis protein [Cardiobacterium sp. AH-315-I02]
MSDFEINVNYDDKKVQAAFDRLIKTGDDMEPVFTAIGEYLLPRHESFWDEGVAPDGTLWANLYPETWARKKHPKILFEEPEMLTRAAFNATANSLELVIPDEKAVHHHYGTEFMPARELLGINQIDEQKIADIIEGFIEAAWQD